MNSEEGDELDEYVDEQTFRKPSSFCVLFCNRIFGIFIFFALLGKDIF